MVEGDGCWAVGVGFDRSRIMGVFWFACVGLMGFCGCFLCSSKR